MPLTIEVPDKEFWDSEKEEFYSIKGGKLTLEHSLVSISKWESKWNKPFLKNQDKTIEETIDYIKCMTLTQNVNPMIYYILSDENINEVDKYIHSPMTATWFSDEPSKKNSNEVITSEIIYYWMIQANIPVKFEKWHLNRLLTLIRVCGAKNAPQKKMTKKEIMERNRKINEARKAAMNSKG